MSLSRNTVVIWDPFLLENHIMCIWNKILIGWEREKEHNRDSQVFTIAIGNWWCPLHDSELIESFCLYFWNTWLQCFILYLLKEVVLEVVHPPSVLCIHISMNNEDCPFLSLKCGPECECIVLVLLFESMVEMKQSNDERRRIYGHL